MVEGRNYETVEKDANNENKPEHFQNKHSTMSWLFVDVSTMWGLVMYIMMCVQDPMWGSCHYTVPISPRISLAERYPDCKTSI